VGLVVRYVVEGERRAEIRTVAAPERGDLVALCGVVYLVSGRTWEYWEDPSADVVLRVELKRAN
jgi:hypothetical protein